MPVLRSEAGVPDCNGRARRSWRIRPHSAPETAGFATAARIGFGKKISRVLVAFTPSVDSNRLTRALAGARRAGRPVLDLTQSNPTQAGLAYPPDLLASLAGARSLRYDPEPLGLREAREAVAADYARQGLSVSPDRIVLTASSSDSYSELFKLLADPGDEILVPRPSYPLFEHLARLDGVMVRRTISSITAAGRWMWAASRAASRRARARCSS